MMIVFSFLLLLGQGLGFQNSWTDPVPGDFQLPNFATFDYKWQDHRFSDVEEKSIIYIFHPLDNTAARTRERNLKELNAIHAIVPVFAVTEEGNWGSNREIEKRIAPQYPVLFSQPDLNLEAWVQTWDKSIPAALLVQDGVVVAHGEPFAMLMLVLDLENNIDIPEFANSGLLGFWSQSPFTSIPPEQVRPKTNITDWIKWKEFNSGEASLTDVREEGILMLKWSSKIEKSAKKNLIGSWLNRVIKTKPPEGQTMDSWLREPLAEIQNMETLSQNSYGWINFLNQNFEQASTSFEKDALLQEGFMASISKVNSLLSKSLNPDLENPQEIVPAYFQEVFEEASASIRAPLFGYLNSMVEKQAQWWPESNPPLQWFFLKGIGLYFGENQEDAINHFDKIKQDPVWMSILEKWGVDGL
tara:strand:+ start:4356 stop:5600 length:1245 start_codon:yes stop_codon:yes gene_type:complete